MTYKLDSRYIGYPAIETVLPATGPTGQPWPPITPGLLCTADDPVWGPGEFIFGKANGAIRQYGLCVLTPTFNATTRVFDQMFTEAPNTANTGRPVYIAMAETGPTGMASGQYGWFMDAGVAPVNGTATVAAGTTVGITAAGQIGANSAGKQVLNAVSCQAASATVIRAVAGQAYGGVNTSGGFQIQVQNVDGLFVGGYGSGTGVGAAAIITAIDRINNVLTMSVANSAAVTGNFTQTNNNATIFYNCVAIDRGLVQGAIT